MELYFHVSYFHLQFTYVDTAKTNPNEPLKC